MSAAVRTARTARTARTMQAVRAARTAEASWRALSRPGLVCVYKPAGVDVRRVQHALRGRLAQDLNALPGSPQEKRVEIIGATNAPMSVEVGLNYADDPLVAGPRYKLEDIKCSYATHLGLYTSGVLLLGINDGTRLTYQVHTGRPTRAYKITGCLGKATDTYYKNGKVMELSTYKHVTRDKIDRIVSHMQAAHQKKMFELCGLHMESQATYDMAVQGLIRPVNNKLPVLYGIKCVHFELPYFTLEVQAVNEYENYLWTLVHDLGMQLKSTAHCTTLQCIRQGKFTLDQALLRKHWTLQHILANMQECWTILQENKRLLKPLSAALL